MALDELEECQGAGSGEEKPSSHDGSVKDEAVKDVDEPCSSNTTGHFEDAQNNNDKVVEENPVTSNEQCNQHLETADIKEDKRQPDAGEEVDNQDNKPDLLDTSECLPKSGILENLDTDVIDESEVDLENSENATQTLIQSDDSKYRCEIKVKANTVTENEVKLNETVQNEQSRESEHGEVCVAKEVIKPKKTQLSCFLSKSYFDEESVLKYGSVDVADDAQIELELLQQKPKGKSWDDELNETVRKHDEDCEREEDKGTVNIVDKNPLEEEGANEKQSDCCCSTNNQDVSTRGLSSDLKANNTESFNEVITAEASFKSTHIGEKESTDIKESELPVESANSADQLVNLSISNRTDRVDGVVIETVERTKGSVCLKDNVQTDISNDSENEDSKSKSNHHIDNSEYDADSSDTESEQIERTKAALLSFLKGKCETFEKVSLKSDRECDTNEQVNLEPIEDFESNENKKSQSCSGIEISVENNCEESDQRTNQTAVLGHGIVNLSMPETRDNIDGSVSPSLMFASCRYRWEQTIFTRSQSVVFVTLNKKEIEPIQLEWSESSKCFYSEEVKVPVGVYIGNLVVDGTFYPVEDIAVKHYTFEVDLYLKDDILEDEGQSSGVAKAEEFIKQKRHTNGQEQEQSNNNKDYTYTSNRASGYAYPSIRARMEDEPVNQNPAEGGVSATSKYEELVRSQMNQNKGALNDNDLESSLPSRSDLSDLEGRRTPVGEDGEKQYQDSDRQLSLEGSASSQTFAKHGPTLDDFFDQRNTYTNGSIQNGLDSLERRTPPAVIDDVLGNGHTRTPIYSTESPVYSKHSSAHSSARQTPTAPDEQARPASVSSVGSVHSANSLSKHVLDDLVSDALGRPRVERTSPALERERSRNYTPARPESVGSAHSDNSASRRAINDLIEDSLNITKTPPPSRESSVQGSRPHTPPPQEQIDDVLNPADRHSPIRREFLAGSPNLSEHSAKGSKSSQSSVHSSAHSSAHSSQRQTPQRELISNSLRASQEKLYSSHSSNSNASSRPQSVTSEQELTELYETSAKIKDVLNKDTSGTNSPGSASSLPVISSQQRYTPDRRSMTPDNHIRVPVVSSITKSSLLPSRTPPRTPLSNASSRTVTPVNIETETESRLREQVKDLENTVSNLRKLLTSREQENVELKNQFSEVRDINEKLQGDLDRHRARASPGPQIAELERKVREAYIERDSLNAEISILKEELQRRKEPGLNSYDPNSPSALQRKIDELNGQIQDLHEAHEAASEEIQAAERKVKQLAAENETLRVTQSDGLRTIEDENRHLKSEVQRLRESHFSHSDVSDYRLKIELQQIKEDNRNLRERNYQLHDDNIRLKEELSDLRKTVEFMDRKVQQRDERVRQFDAYERSDDDTVLKSRYHGELSYSRLSEPRRPAEREWESYSVSRSNYDSQKTEPIRDYDYNEDKITKLESMRYESFRTGPDGGSSDKVRASLSYSGSLNPERPGALGPPKMDTTLTSKSQERIDLVSRTVDRSDLDLRARRERSRTSSAEIDLRSTPLTAYHGDLSKTTPALSGRSRAIYKEISDSRARSKANMADDDKKTNQCESGESDNNPQTENTNNCSNQNNQAHSSQVFMNRFVPQTPVSEVEETDTDTRRLQLAEKLDPAYARREAKVTHQRETLEKKVEMLEKQAEKQSLFSSLPIVTKSGYCDDGNMSDTATDILVNIKPVDKIPTSSWNKSRQRRGSVGSDASNSSFSDIDEQITASVRRRSKSADGREVLRRMGPSGSSGKENLTLSRTLSPAPSAGLRTVTPRPIPTQHNKSALSLSTSLNSLTSGLRPFAPRSAQDLQINDVIKFSRQGGKLSQGTIKFIGHLPGRGDIYLGVELDKEDGKHDGVFEGIRYFKCKPTKGVFVAYNKVVMAWTA